MDLLNQVRRIEMIDQRIKLNLVGKPTVLAKELHTSESQLYEFLKFMKKSGAPLTFSRKDKCYSYTKRMKFTFGFVDPKDMFTCLSIKVGLKSKSDSYTH